MKVIKVIVAGKKTLLHTGNREYRKSMYRFEKKLHESSRKPAPTDLWPSDDWKPIASARITTFIKEQVNPKDLPEILAQLRKTGQRKPGGNRHKLKLIHWKPNQQPMERRRYWAAYEKGLKSV